MNPHQHRMRAGRALRASGPVRSTPVPLIASDAQYRRDRGAIRAQVAADQRDVAFAAVHFALVSDHAELAIARLDAALAGADNVALVAQPVADQLGHGENQQLMSGRTGSGLECAPSRRRRA